MEILPYPIYLAVSDSGDIRFTTTQDNRIANLLAIFSLHDLVKLHFLFLQFRQRDALFLLEAGGTGFYKLRKNCIQGDRWCIGVGLTGEPRNGSHANQSGEWFRHSSRKVTYRVNPDIRLWITWPAMRKIFETLDDKMYAILARENHVASRRFIPCNDPMLRELGPSMPNITYLKAVCKSMFTEKELPAPRPIDQLCIAIGQISTSEPITSRATKIPNDQYPHFYKMYMANATDADIARRYNVSSQSVRRTRQSINEFVYKYRERAWDAWELLFEELMEKHHQDPRQTR